MDRNGLGSTISAGVTTPARLYTILAVAALILAAFNITFRLNREMVDVWDESLFATSALELLDHGRWAITTFQGEVDYYNSKPPLNVWLIALSFKLFGVGLVSLRLPAALSAWLTVLVVQRWSWRVLGPRVSVLATLVLATTYGFLYVHSGRTANADAPMTLAVTLVAYVAWRAQERPILMLWLGPLCAAVTLLKGPAALMYVVPVVAAMAARPANARPVRFRHYLVATVLFLLPIGAWVYARWRFDQWQFLAKLVFYDGFYRAHSPVDEHAGPPWFYLDVLQRFQYEWLLVVVAAVILARSSLARMWSWGREPGHRRFVAVLIGWLVATLGLPSILSTKITWYLNPFYPLFAMLTAALACRAWTTLVARGQMARARTLGGIVVVALLFAEGKLARRSYTQLDLGRSAQELLITQADAIEGARVFAKTCPFPEAFLARAAGAECLSVESLETFLRVSSTGDMWMAAADETSASLVRLAGNRGASLHRRP